MHNNVFQSDVTQEVTDKVEHAYITLLSDTTIAKHETPYSFQNTFTMYYHFPVQKIRYYKEIKKKIHFEMLSLFPISSNMKR